jgi:ABC-type sugar transport system ATPase subunit
MGIEAEALGVRAGSFTLSGLSFEIPGGEYAVLMGRTGSGKTTILEAICGLRRVTSGRIRLAGRDVTSLRPADRGIGYVPQDRALFKTMTVREHLAFSLAVRKWSGSLIAQRVAELAAWLGLEKLLERRPEGLSGGEGRDEQQDDGQATLRHGPIMERNGRAFNRRTGRPGPLSPSSGGPRPGSPSPPLSTGASPHDG